MYTPRRMRYNDMLATGPRILSTPNMYIDLYTETPGYQKSPNMYRVEGYQTIKSCCD